MRSLISYSLCIVLWCVALIITACQPQAAAETAPLIIHGKNGAHIFTVEVARTPDELSRGLMFRKELADDAGMLFIFPETKEVSFWMKNTFIPLDMLFIRSDGSVARVHSNAIPHDEKPIFSGDAVKAVLEIPGGQADKRGIAAGARVETDLLSKD